MKDTTVDVIVISGAVKKLSKEHIAIINLYINLVNRPTPISTGAFVYLNGIVKGTEREIDTETK